MNYKRLPKATLGRLPLYLNYLKSSVSSHTVSASVIAHGLAIGEVTVRKDLNLVSGEGRPRIGYLTENLIACMEQVLGFSSSIPVVIVGAGKLGRALQAYRGFAQFGFHVLACFDCDPCKLAVDDPLCPILPMETLGAFCREHEVHLGIITVPETAAQSVCNDMVRGGITEIWNFSPCKLQVSDTVIVQQENLALSVAHLHMCAANRQLKKLQSVGQ